MNRTMINTLRLLPSILAASFPLVSTGCADPGTSPSAIERPPSIERPSAGETRNGSTLPSVSLTQQAGTASGGDPVLAEVRGVRVMQSQVMPLLIESYGLDVLLKVMQLNMAKAEAAREGLTVSPADEQREREIWLTYLSPGTDEADSVDLLKQYLQRQHISEAEFDIVMRANAYLRALVSKAAAAQVTDEMVRNEFNATYGERVQIRHIALNNMQEVAEARARLASGTPFIKVVQDMSRYPTTARLEGVLPPFSRMTTGVSKAVIDAAFALQTEGEISQETAYDGHFYHIIQLIKRVAPTAVKFEDVQDSVRRTLVQRLEQVAMGNLRNQMAERARRDLQILEPVLAKQFQERLAAANPTVPTNKDETNRKLDETREKLQNAREAATRPAMIAPAAATTTNPAQPTPSVSPATMP